MINCFPKIYEDELLYSIIARYRRVCGIGNRQAISRDFYSLEQGIISALFPLHLNRISSVISPGNKITGEALLRNNTIFEFCTKFLSKERSNEIKDSMLGETNVNLLMKVGISSSGVKWSKWLKFCPICVEEDLKLEALGESYWRREHQYMGVLICKKHKVFLQNSSIKTIETYLEHICANDIKIEESSSYDGRFIEYNLKYIDLVNELITHVYRHDKEWYYKVTPKHIRKVRSVTIDWNKRDMELLEKVKIAVNNILNRPEKPIRICRQSIRKELEMTRGINNPKLVDTNKYIKTITENYEDYWKRKIKWAIDEMLRDDEHSSVFNIQLKCGFGGHYRPK